MKIKALLGIVAAVALCACQSKTSTQRTAGTANDTGGAPMTLVGCLVPGNSGTPNGTVGTSGNTGTAGFTLIDATNTSAAAAGAGTASGASGTPETPGATGTAGRSYGLVAGQDRRDELQKYLNSRVEVIGSAVASADTGAVATDGASAGAPAGGAASAPAGTQASNVPHVRVESVRQLATSCNGLRQ
jgi:hypothetical protein